MKRCPGYNGYAEHIADETAFHKDSQQFDGLSIYCRECRKGLKPDEYEDPMLLGDLFEKCRAMIQLEMRRLELGRIKKDNSKFKYIQEAIEILCKLKVANIGTTSSELADMKTKAIETLMETMRKELESRKVAKEAKKLKNNNETITQPPNDK